MQYSSSYRYVQSSLSHKGTAFAHTLETLIELVLFRLLQSCKQIVEGIVGWDGKMP